MDTDEIKEELLHTGIKVKYCTKLKSKNNFSFSYLITTNSEENLKNIRRVEAVGYTKAKWESYKKTKQYTQCFRCQKFNHGAMNMRPRCVKCGKEHFTYECKLVKTETSKATCANCDGDDPANYGRCPELE